MKTDEFNFRRMTRKQMIQALNVHPETFDAWISQGAPIEEGEGRTALHDIGRILEWRVERERQNKKNSPKIKVKAEEKEENLPPDPEALLKQKIAEQELRKKIRENDLSDGLLVNKKEMEDLFFRMGRALRDNLMSKNTVWGPQLNMVSGFEATTYLRKECEKLCNSLAYLNNISDEELAHEYHEYFMLGFNYAKGNQ